MKKLVSTLTAILGISTLAAQDVVVKGPDEKLQLAVFVQNETKPCYSVSYNGKTMLEKSPLGMNTNIGDFTKNLKLTGHSVDKIDTVYQQTRIKVSNVHYRANELTCHLENEQGQKLGVVFRVSDNDVAFRYTLPHQGGKASVTVKEEQTGFRFPEQTTTFLCPQSDAMIGWKRTKPSYEEEYKADAPMSDRSQYGHGYTFPCLFRIGNDGWVLVSETGVDSRYCGSRLSDVSEGNLYTVAFPMAEENNGNGTVAPAFALPGATPWRTITVGDHLKPIVETTVPWDVVSPLYETKHDYRFGRGTWSWILWQDGSINYDDQVRYIDFASAMGYEYALIDNWWDTRIGHQRMKSLVEYARDKGVELFLWYSSSGYWNDIEQGPVNRMDNAIIRKREMKWLQSLGVKGIKVDFFGGDKQETFNTCLHPFIRNTVGSMEFGGCFLNKRLNRNNDGGTTRRTTDVFQLATTVLFQNPVQNFALAPNNLKDVPAVCMDFMKRVPTTWDETRFVDGYPGKYVVLARRQGDTWYLAAVNAGKEPLKLKLDLEMFAGKTVALYKDDKKGEPELTSLKVKENGKVQLEIRPQGGILCIK